MAIFIGFVLLAAVALWGLTSRGRWPLRLAAIVSIPVFGFAVWASLGSFKGYPSPEKPAKGTFLASAVDEPRRIYLWLVPLDHQPGSNPLDYKPASGEPRAYVLPYSRELHQAVTEASALGRRGAPIGFQFSPRIPRSHFRFYRLPPSVPSKEAP